MNSSWPRDTVTGVSGLSHKVKLAVAAVGAMAVLALPGSAPAGTLYSNNYSDKQIVAMSIGADGLLSPVAGSPFAVPDFLGGLAITPDGQRMIGAFYFNDQLGTYALAADGTPSQLGPLVSGQITRAPAISPDGRFAYLGSQTGGVVAYALGSGGSLTKVGGTFGTANGEGPALTPDGRFLLMPDYTTGAVERFAVQPDGSLAFLGTTPTIGTGALAIRVTPDGRFAVVLSDPEGAGVIEALAIGGDGSLTPIPGARETEGLLSGVPTLSPNGRFYYNANANENTISAYSIAANGALAENGAPVPTGLTDSEGLAMSVDGRFLYVARGDGEFIQGFSVAADGTLAKLGGPAFTGGDSDGTSPVARPAVPTARFTATAAAPGSGSRFDATASSDAGARLTTYSWNFGDGTTLTSADPRPTHTYVNAGVYDVTLTVGDDANCTGFVYTGQTAYCNARGATTTLRIDTPPTISPLKVIRKRFKAATASARKGKGKPPRRIAFRYTLSENAGVTFTIQRKVLGRKGAGGRCLRATKANITRPRCFSWRTLGSFGSAGKTGNNVTRLPNRVNRRKLRPGAYRTTAVASDAAGGVSTPRSAKFKIKLPKRTGTPAVAPR